MLFTISSKNSQSALINLPQSMKLKYLIFLFIANKELVTRPWI